MAREGIGGVPPPATPAPGGDAILTSGDPGGGGSISSAHGIGLLFGAGEPNTGAAAGTPAKAAAGAGEANDAGMGPGEANNGGAGTPPNAGAGSGTPPNKAGAGPEANNPGGFLNPLLELGVLEAAPKTKVLLSLILDLNLRQKL